MLYFRLSHAHLQCWHGNNIKYNIKKNIKIFTEPHRFCFQRDVLIRLFIFPFLVCFPRPLKCWVATPVRPLILSFNTCSLDTASKQLCQELRPVLPALIKHLVHHSLVPHVPVVWCKLGNAFCGNTAILKLCWGLAHVYRAAVQHPQRGKKVSCSEVTQTRDGEECLALRPHKWALRLRHRPNLQL